MVSIVGNTFTMSYYNNIFSYFSAWMQKPQGPPGCPPGLEYLAMIDQLVVKQQVELLEGKETVNMHIS